MTISWNDLNDARLLVAILKHGKPILDHKVLSAEMTECVGSEVTPSSVEHRLRKLKAKGSAASDGKPDSPGGKATGSNVEKVTTKAKATLAPKRKKNDVSHNDETTENPGETAKPTRKRAKKSSPTEQTESGNNETTDSMEDVIKAESPETPILPSNDHFDCATNAARPGANKKGVARVIRKDKDGNRITEPPKPRNTKRNKTPAELDENGQPVPKPMKGSDFIKFKA